jgi:hypothetical protein
MGWDGTGWLPRANHLHGKSWDEVSLGRFSLRLGRDSGQTFGRQL